MEHLVSIEKEYFQKIQYPFNIGRDYYNDMKGYPLNIKGRFNYDRDIAYSLRFFPGQSDSKIESCLSIHIRHVTLTHLKKNKSV